MSMPGLPSDDEYCDAGRDGSTVDAPIPVKIRRERRWPYWFGFVLSGVMIVGAFPFSVWQSGLTGKKASTLLFWVAIGVACSRKLFGHRWRRGGDPID